MSLILDLYQQTLIYDALTKAERANRKAKISIDDVHDLQRKADALTIACQALWEIVKEHSGIPENVILDKMQEIDARDGRLDGKITPTVLECEKCHRKSNSRRQKCLYCGNPLAGEHIFEKG